MLNFEKESDGWKILKIINPFTPRFGVQVYPLSKDSILIFGGDNSDDKELDDSLILNVSSLELTPTNKMQEPDDFYCTHPPMKIENTIFAVSYDHNIHSFDLKTQEWEIILKNKWFN